MTVVPLSRPDLETIKALEALLSKARAGKIRGLLFACKQIGTRPTVGATGDYLHDPDAAIGAAHRLIDALKEIGQ